jgi:polyketide cyclase/dehydrase/lipid transport protein
LTARTAARQIAHTVRRRAPVPVERLFDVVVAEDVLPHVLHRWGPIPGVRETRELSGPWDIPGSTRTVVLADGHTAREQVIAWARPIHFEYRVSDLDGRFGQQFEFAVGEWEFADEAGGSAFRWTYTFHGASRLMALAVPLAWARYMAGCADRCVALAARGR